MSEHTKEPWYASQEGGEWRVMAADENGGYTLADMHCDDTEANARRIVACVNACAGIDTEMLEIVSENDKTLAKCYREIEQQRDALLNALLSIATGKSNVPLTHEQRAGLYKRIAKDAIDESRLLK